MANSRSISFCLGILLALPFNPLSGCSSLKGGAKEPKREPCSTGYPSCRVENASDTYFGVQVKDPYRWLEDERSSEVRNWMKDQNEIARSHLDRLPEREAILSRLNEIYSTGGTSSPIKEGGRFFFLRRDPGKQKQILYWRDQAQGAVEHSLFDPNPLEATSFAEWAPSRDGRKLVYTLHPNSADLGTLHVRDVQSGVDSEIDRVVGVKFTDPRWAADSSGFFYVKWPDDPSIPEADQQAHAEVRFHRLGTSSKEDRVVYPKTGNPESWLSVQVSRDGRWLFVTQEIGWARMDVYYRDLKAGWDSPFKTLVQGEDARFEVIAWKDDFYIRTNLGAPQFQVFKTKASSPERTHWKRIVPTRKDTVIESMKLVSDRLVLRELRNASHRLSVRSLEGRFEGWIDLPSLGTVSGLGGEPDDDELFYEFGSPVVPYDVRQASVRTRKSRVWAQAAVPVDPSRFALEQVWYPSKDGTKVSMFIVRPKTARLDGSNPLLLTGYGGFSNNQLPDFDKSLYPWLERGGIWALPNLRGGAEYGEDWHRAGMLERKQNTFDDFIGAAEYLIARGYTSPSRLAIHGGSNGGLLVAAAAVQRPELFGAVVCENPVIDMIRYPLFGAGKFWVPEYGSPQVESQFRALLAYSPYHQAKAARYPAFLVRTSDHDDRVDPMHARKLAAVLQTLDQDESPVLLSIQKNAGHLGGDELRFFLEKTASSYAFMLDALRLKKE